MPVLHQGIHADKPADKPCDSLYDRIPGALQPPRNTAGSHYDHPLRDLLHIRAALPFLALQPPVGAGRHTDIVHRNSTHGRLAADRHLGRLYGREATPDIGGGKPGDGAVEQTRRIPVHDRNPQERNRAGAQGADIPAVRRPNPEPEGTRCGKMERRNPEGRTRHAGRLRPDRADGQIRVARLRIPGGMGLHDLQNPAHCQRLAGKGEKRYVHRITAPDGTTEYQSYYYLGIAELLRLKGHKFDFEFPAEETAPGKR